MGKRVRIGFGWWLVAAGAVALGIYAVVGQGFSGGELWEYARPWCWVLAAAVAHEAGHLLAAWGMDVRVAGFTLDVLGARMELTGVPSYGQEIFVAAGGPFASMVGAAVAYPFAAQGGDGAAVFCGASLMMGGMNLLPVATLNGGRILGCAVAYRWGERAAAGVLRGTTAMCWGLLWMLSVYGLLWGGAYLSAFAFSLCLLGRSVGVEGDSHLP